MMIPSRLTIEQLDYLQPDQVQQVYIDIFLIYNQFLGFTRLQAFGQPLTSTPNMEKVYHRPPALSTSEIFPDSTISIKGDDEVKTFRETTVFSENSKYFTALDLNFSAIETGLEFFY
jgi:hypothetical protein